jgi:Flp pilus assembly protein TadG
MTDTDNKLNRGRALLARLRSDASGNVLAMTAASMIPLMAIVGGGIDAGRLYATKSRLQHACDAAALAGRKSMNGVLWSAANETIADNFFDNNFPSGKYGSSNQSISYEINNVGDVKGRATATVPSTIMRMFGNTQDVLNVTCTAKLELPNSDIMFVLDTTGSMASTNSGDSVNKITALKNAVRSFHTQLEAAKTSQSRMRYGFVPYATNVNVGRLLNANWMADQATYQSREPAGTVVTGGDLYTQEDWSGWTNISGSESYSNSTYNAETCNPENDNLSVNTWQQISQTSSPYAGPPSGTQTVTTFRQTLTGIDEWVEDTGSNCKVHRWVFNNRVRTITRTTYPARTPIQTTYKWNYKPVAYNVAALGGLQTGGSITAPIGWQHSNRTVDWNGCIEERATTRDQTYVPIPALAYDLDIDMVPTTDPNTQWKPALAGLVFSRWNMDSWSYNPVLNTTDEYQNVLDFNGGANARCPAAARKLAEMTAAQVTSYLATLNTDGFTYHDIGFVWGARLLSSTGLFASENATAPNGGPIARHLIFMTDGDTNTQLNQYEAYGFPALDRRRQSDPNANPSKSTTDTLVERRLTALCTATKAKGITVWVIAFGTSLTSLLSNCASTGRAYQANNAAQLNAAFVEIASAIAKLRLTE